MDEDLGSAREPLIEQLWIFLRVTPYLSYPPG